MGREKQSGNSTTVVNQTQTPQPTPEETALNQRNLRIAQATEAPETQVQLAGLGLINQLLAGQVPTSPLYQNISQISPEAIGSQATELTRQSLPGFQSGGLIDSGVMQREIARTIASQLLFPAEQYNIGAKQNLLNLALSGQAQVQAPIQANINNLSASLAGLRSINQTGIAQMNSTQYGMNPFVKSFQQSAGEGIGKFVGGLPGAGMRAFGKGGF